jgi:hypothetical protein
MYIKFTNFGLVDSKSNIEFSKNNTNHFFESIHTNELHILIYTNNFFWKINIQTR